MEVKENGKRAKCFGDLEDSRRHRAVFQIKEQRRRSK
jgi:hypothetical protein